MEDYSGEHLPQLNLRLQEQEPRYSEALLQIHQQGVLVEGVYLAVVALIHLQALQVAYSVAAQEQLIQQLERELGQAYLEAVLLQQIHQLLQEEAYLGEELHQPIRHPEQEQGQDYLGEALQHQIPQRVPGQGVDYSDLELHQPIHQLLEAAFHLIQH